MDKLSTAGAESVSDRQDSSPSPASSSSTAHQTEQLRLQREFDFTMAMANLISELVHVMGWDRNRQLPESPTPYTGGGGACGEERVEQAPRPILRSIFQPRFCASPVVLTSTAAPPATAAPKTKAGNCYKTRSDFTSRSAYVEYIQDNLKSGMMVRMLEDYEEVSAGDEGEFRYSNDGTPPVQVRTFSLVFTLIRLSLLTFCVVFRCTGTPCPGLTGSTGTWWRYWATVAAAVRRRRRSRRKHPP